MNELVVRHRVYIASQPARIFRLLTTAEGWCGWFTANATVEPRPGGVIRFEWVDFGPDHYTATDQGHVVDVVPDRRFAFTWHPGTHETTVTFELEPCGPGCLLSVRETGHRLDADDVQVALQVATGWGEALTLLKFHVELGARYGHVPTSINDAP